MHLTTWLDKNAIAVVSLYSTQVGVEILACDEKHGYYLNRKRWKYEI